MVGEGIGVGLGDAVGVATTGIGTGVTVAGMISRVGVTKGGDAVKLAVAVGPVALGARGCGSATGPPTHDVNKTRVARDAIRTIRPMASDLVRLRLPPDAFCPLLNQEA